MLGSTKYINDNVVTIKGVDYITVDDAKWAAEIARGIGARTGKHKPGVLKEGGVAKRTRVRRNGNGPVQ